MVLAPNFAHDWIASWNAHDLDRVLAFYTEDFEMSSPLIIKLMNEPSATLHGKAAIRQYWAKGLSLLPNLHFTLETVYTGANSIVICYTNQDGRHCGELLCFNDQGLCFCSAAHHI